MSHACHTICALSTSRSPITRRFTKNTQHDTSKVLCLPHKMKIGTFQNDALATKIQVICGKTVQSIAPVTQNDVCAFADTSDCREVPRLPRKTTWQPLLKPSQMTSFAASLIGRATPAQNQRIETRDFLNFSQFVAPKPTFSYEFSSWAQDLLPQNRCFVRGFCQFSSHVTKCHACHGICTLSPLDAALPMRFAKHTQHDTSKVLRLPHEMTMKVSKVLRLPRKMQVTFWKRFKYIVRVTQNEFWHLLKHIAMSRSATRATRYEVTRHLKPPKAIAVARRRLRTVANGGGCLRS